MLPEGEITVRLVELLNAPETAVIVVFPVPTRFAKPWLPAKLLMVATDGFEELHVAEVVRFWFVPSVKVSVAVNGTFVPNVSVKLAGVTARATGTGGITVSVVEADRRPKDAEMLVVPIVEIVACPFVPGALLIDATVRFEEFQVTEAVTS